ncbi:hypothetical protein ABZ502_16750 [Streptomyces abikoensis]|uniref:hypothetical protein n=1 Tax=Streptomyces abikoensis TaxID=97398 RepID=UPI0033F991CE
MPNDARPFRYSTLSIVTDTAWWEAAREVRAATDLILQHSAYGLSRSSAGWVVEDHLRRALDRMERVLDRHAAAARTRLGRCWRRRKMRVYVDQLQDALWFSQRMQGQDELIWPPALCFRDGTLPLLDQVIGFLHDNEPTLTTGAGQLGGSERGGRHHAYWYSRVRLGRCEHVSRKQCA